MKRARDQDVVRSCPDEERREAQRRPIPFKILCAFTIPSGMSPNRRQIRRKEVGDEIKPSLAEGHPAPNKKDPSGTKDSVQSSKLRCENS